MPPAAALTRISSLPCALSNESRCASLACIRDCLPQSEELELNSCFYTRWSAILCRLRQTRGGDSSVLGGTTAMTRALHDLACLKFLRPWTRPRNCCPRGRLQTCIINRLFCGPLESPDKCWRLPKPDIITCNGTDCSQKGA